MVGKYRKDDEPTIGTTDAIKKTQVTSYTPRHPTRR
jgi:hypothetical protein